MRVIIAGAGEVGRGVAAALRGEKRGVAMIDPDPNAISDSQSLDCLLIRRTNLWCTYVGVRVSVRVKVRVYV